jgi:hypothetical protein
VWRHGGLGFRQHLWVRFLHHLLAKIHAHQIVLKYIVVEHVLGSFAEIHDPFSNVGRANSESHVLRVGSAGRVIIAADSADATGDEMSVAWILTLHKNAVAAEDRGGAVTLGHLTVLKVDLGENSQATHNPGDRIPIHLHQISRPRGSLFI